MNPYDLLGISPDADASTIRRRSPASRHVEQARLERGDPRKAARGGKPVESDCSRQAGDLDADRPMESDRLSKSGAGLPGPAKPGRPQRRLSLPPHLSRSALLGRHAARRAGDEPGGLVGRRCPSRRRPGDIAPPTEPPLSRWPLVQWSRNHWLKRRRTPRHYAGPSDLTALARVSASSIKLEGTCGTCRHEPWTSVGHGMGGRGARAGTRRMDRAAFRTPYHVTHVNFHARLCAVTWPMPTAIDSTRTRG